MTRTGDILGYARVSTADQDLSGQITRLKDAGALRVFEDVISGKQFERPGLSTLLDQARPGDTPCDHAAGSAWPITQGTVGNR